MYGLFPQKFNLINNFKIPWVKTTWLLGANACAVEEGSPWEVEVEDVCTSGRKLESVRLKGAEVRALYFLLPAQVKQRCRCAA